MLSFNKLIAGGRGLAPALLKRAATVEIDWDVRQKSRFDATDSLGRAVAVFLPRGSVLRGADVLLAEDGTLLRVLAAQQPVLQVTPCAEHGSPFDLMRAAYHLGNRHVQLELRPERLQLEPDHVLAAMLRAMHLTVVDAQAPFEPEAGAYAVDRGHHHAHDAARAPGALEPARAPAHDHARDSASAHDPAPTAGRGRPVGIAVQPAAAPHVHGLGCDHDH